MKPIAITAFVALLAAPLFADEVVLKSGGRLTGIARTEGERVIVELPIGTAVFPASEIESITPGRTALHDYQDRIAGIGESGGAPEHYALALWAKEQGLSRYIPGLLEKTIAIEPDHADARQMLGFVRHDDRWMTEPERMKALGNVLFRGRWMLPEERDAIVAGESAARVKQGYASAQRRREDSSPERIVEGTNITLGLPMRVYQGGRPSQASSTGDDYLWQQGFLPPFFFPTVPMPAQNQPAPPAPVQHASP